MMKTTDPTQTQTDQILTIALNGLHGIVEEIRDADPTWLNIDRRRAEDPRLDRIVETDDTPISADFLRHMRILDLIHTIDAHLTALAEDVVYDQTRTLPRPKEGPGDSIRYLWGKSRETHRALLNRVMKRRGVTEPEHFRRSRRKDEKNTGQEA